MLLNSLGFVRAQSCAGAAVSITNSFAAAHFSCVDGRRRRHSLQVRVQVLIQVQVLPVQVQVQVCLCHAQLRTGALLMRRWHRCRRRPSAAPHHPCRPLVCPLATAERARAAGQMTMVEGIANPAAAGCAPVQ